MRLRKVGWLVVSRKRTPVQCHHVILLEMDFDSLQAISAECCQIFSVLPQLPKLWCKKQRGPHI